MKALDPLNNFTRNHDRSNVTRYFNGIKSIILHVEDQKNGTLYEILLKKIYANTSKTFIVLDSFSGKTGVTKEALKGSNSVERSKCIYLLDKDFNDKFPDKPEKRMEDKSYNEMLEIKGVRFLKKYSIENHLFSLDKMVEYLELKGVNSQRINTLNLSLDEYLQIGELIGPLFLLNNYYELGMHQELSLFFNDIDLEFNESTYSDYQSELKEKYEQKIGGTNYETNLQEMKESFNSNDIPGKSIIYLFLKYLNLKTGAGINKKELPRRQAQNISNADLEEFKEILMS